MELREIKGKVDFAIITIREDELKAVLKRFPGETVESHNRFYRVSKVPVGEGSTVLVAIARAFEQGTGEAQTIARHIIDDLDPHWILVVGIAGGVPDSEHTLGDVVLSTRVNDLTVHAHQEAAPTQYALSGGPSTHSVTKLIMALPMLESKFEGWNTQDSIGRQRPAVDLSKPESFYGDEEWQKKVRDSLNHHFGPSVASREPLVRAGPIDSSDGLIKDTKTLQHWLTLTRDALAVEMEAAGVYRAVRSGGREYAFLSIRGLSDIVGFKRHPDWTAYACHSAAAFTHALIKSGLVKRRAEAPTPEQHFASVHPREAHERYRQGNELLARVRLFADLKETHDGWGVRIEERRARPPLGEYLHVVKSKGPHLTEYPLAAVAQITPEVLDAFLTDAHEHYRIRDPRVHSTLVYEGAAPDATLAAQAHDKGLLLQSITEYMGVPNFSSYLSEQSRQLQSTDAYLSQFYIEQRAVITVESRDTSTDDALERVQQWMNERLGHLVLVLGDFGTGKTFLLRELALRMARDVPQGPIPLFIELRRLEKKPTLDELIASQLAHAKMNTIPVEAIRVMLGDGRIALLFDGFDEYVQRVTYPRAAEHLSTLIQVASDKTKIVITSRTQHFESEHQVREALTKGSSSPRGYQLMRLQPFTKEQIHRFMAKRLGDPIEAAKRSLLLDELPDLPSLAVNPRMLSFILDLPEEDLRKAKERHQSMTRAGLYELLLDRWFQGETLRIGPGLSTKQRWGAVTELAMKLWLTGEPAISLHELSNEFVETIQKLEDRRLEPGEAQHQIGSGTLLVRDEQKKFSFIHQSVMEWLVAKKIAGSIQQGTTVPELASQTLSGLMVEFLCELAGGRQAEQWAQTALDASGDAKLHKNALTLLGKLGVEPRARKSRAGQDLRGENFSGKDLSNLDFSGADFTGVSLVRAKLTGAILVGARFQRADLSEANLERADLSGADLSGARLLEASMLGATLKGTRFHQAKLLKARFDSGALDGREDDLWGAAHSQSGSPVPTVSASSYYSSVAYSPDGRLLAAGCGCSLQLWDMESGLLLRVLQEHERPISCVAFSPDGKTLASGSEDSTVRLWDADKGTERRVLKGHSYSVRSVVFSPDGKTLASGSDDNTVRLWDADKGTERRVLKGHSYSVRSVAFSPDGKTLASGSFDNTVRLWDADKDTDRRVLKGHSQSVWSVAFSPDGKTLASGSVDNTVRLWDADKGTERRVLKGHSQGVWSVAFSPDGKTLASGSDDNTVHLWDADKGTERLLKGHSQGVRSVAFSPDGKTLASGSGDKTMRLWDAAKGTERLLKGHAQGVWSVAFSPDGKTLASGSRDNTMRLWDADKGAERRVVKGHSQGVWSVAFSPDGKTLASGSDDNTVRLWDADKGTERRVLKGHSQSVWSVAFSPDGKTLASGSVDNTVRLWDADKGTERRVLKGHSYSVRSVAFSPDGKTLASGSDDNTMRLWDADKGTERRVLKGHSQGVWSVAFSPDGKTLASGSFDNTVHLWDADKGTERLLKGHSQGVWSVAFSPDGKTLASGSDDNTVRLWDVASGECLAVLVSLAEGWVAFTPDGRYRSEGALGGAFWHAISLCRFEPGELEPYLPLRVPQNELLYSLPR